MMSADHEEELVLCRRVLERDVLKRGCAAAIEADAARGVVDRVVRLAVVHPAVDAGDCDRLRPVLAYKVIVRHMSERAADHDRAVQRVVECGECRVDRLRGAFGRRTVTRRAVHQIDDALSLCRVSLYGKRNCQQHHRQQQDAKEFEVLVQCLKSPFFRFNRFWVRNLIIHLSITITFYTVKTKIFSDL